MFGLAHRSVTRPSLFRRGGVMYFRILVPLDGFPFLCPADLPRESPKVSIVKTALELRKISSQGPLCGSPAPPPHEFLRRCVRLGPPVNGHTPPLISPFHEFSHAQVEAGV